MQALVLAAGEGKRLKPLTSTIPKALLPVCGRPFIEHIILALKNAGIKDIGIVIGWRNEEIVDFLGNGKKYSVKIDYIHQEALLGTADAISCGRDWVKDRFICLNGDIVLFKNTISELLNFSKKYKQKNLVVLAKSSCPQEYGVAKIDKNNRILEITEKPEKPKTNLVNAGIYIFNNEIFDYIDRIESSIRGEYEITDALRELIEEDKLYGYLQKGPWVDVAKPWDLLKANEILMPVFLKNGKNDGIIEKNTRISKTAIIGKGTLIKSGAYIEGFVHIGENCEIGPNCYIKGNSSIGNNCKIGNAVEIKNSIIMNNVKILHLAYIGDSIIGNGCNFGAGTKIANLRFDNKNVFATMRGKKIDTGRRKLGAIMGDNVRTGINSMIDAGTIVCERTYIGPGAFVSGYIEARSRVG
ncbi:MAG: bifunctional sugar-1-phosphate nucleotidylyltransferase/acetyltransferase [Candidatus Thermoplasmatota archaeon]